MQKFCLYGLVCLGLFVVTGCGPSTPTQPSEEKVKELNTAMDTSMKEMTKGISKTPGSPQK